MRPNVCLVAVAMSLLFSACGTGSGVTPGGAPLPPPADFLITTTALPSGAPGEVYTDTQLETDGEQGPVTWQVVAGALPDGIDLDEGGLLSGTPASAGSFEFTVEANDTVDVATQALSIVVSNFQVTVSDGLVFGDAWSERGLTITAVGNAGQVTFEVATNTSGGVLSDVNAPAGTATYTPGDTAGDTDVVTVTDSGSGATLSVELDIRAHPTVNHVARFGTTDVWWLEFDAKRSSHPYTSDLHQSLVDIGFWPSTSTGAASNDFERLVEMLVRVTILRELNLIYLREADGSQGDEGLEISFPFDEPDAATYSAPSAGGTLGGSPTNYSIMEFADAVSQAPGVLGVAILDGNNDRHEHDGGDALGVLTDRVTSSFLNWQSSRLLDEPLTADDTDVLKALLYGEPLTGERYDAVKELLEFWSRAMAIVTAHEVGHSLGLLHNGEDGTLLDSSISFSTANLGTSNAVSFTAAEIATLEADLPGPGKSTSALTLSKPQRERPGYDVVSLTAANGE